MTRRCIARVACCQNIDDVQLEPRVWAFGTPAACQYQECYQREPPSARDDVGVAFGLLSCCTVRQLRACTNAGCTSILILRLLILVLRR